MPQVFQVLCCFNCEMFQVQFVKKSNKWQCKVCNKKQSLKKAFKIGSAPDCRSLVQELNMQKAYKNTADDDEWENLNCEIPPELLEYGSNDSEEANYKESVECNRSIKDKISGNNYKIDRYVPDNASEISIENSILKEENSKVPQTTETQTGTDSMINAMIEKREQCDFIFNKNRKINSGPEKRPVETSFEQSTQAATTLPPFKKNKGFQLIKNAALKLS